MVQYTTFNLPNEQTMRASLEAVKALDEISVDLYPTLLRRAGQKSTPEGLVQLIALALYECVPPQILSDSAIASTLCVYYMDTVIDAIVADEAMATQAKEHFKKVAHPQRPAP